MKKRMLKIMSMGVTACLLLGTTPTPMLTKAAVTETANHIANKSKESEKTETKKSKESEAVNTEKTKETEIPGAKKEKESETVKSEKSKETEIKKAKESETTETKKNKESETTETKQTKETAAAETGKIKEPETANTDKNKASETSGTQKNKESEISETKKETVSKGTETQKVTEVQKETKIQKETETQKKNEAAKQKAKNKAAASANKKQGIALQNAAEISVTTQNELRAALKNDAVQTINIEGSFTYTYEVETDKKIVIKNGAVFKWSAYQDTFRITDMLIENGAVFQISPFDFMSKAVVAGTITNQGDIQVTSARGECFFTASVKGSGTFSQTTEQTYISYGAVQDAMITGTGYRINLLKDLSVTPTVSLPDSMQTGDTITPIFTNIIDGVDLSKAFTYKWNNGSYDIYNGASSPMLTKSGTLKLTVSPKKPYIMRTSTNSYPGSLDARGTVQKKQYDVIYVDPANGNNNNLGDTKETSMKTITGAMNNLTENGTIVLLGDYSSYTVIDKNVTIKSEDAKQYSFAPTLALNADNLRVTLDSVNLSNLTATGYGTNETLTIKNSSGSIQSTDQNIANVQVEDSNLSGRLTASQNLEFKNVTFSGKFQTEKFIADGKNILIPEKNRISRIDGTATITNPITIQTEPVKGKKVLEISENNKDTILSKLKLADTQNDKFQMKVSKQYNGTYITITQRVTSGGKLLIANEPFIGEAVEDSYATMRNEDCSVKTAVWSGYSHAAGSKWAAGDVPELTITLKVWSSDGTGVESKHFDETFRAQDIKVYSWKDLDTYPDTDSDTNLNKDAEILVKDGQGLSTDGETFTFTLRYPAVERMEQTITTDCSARSAYCTEKLAARPVQAQGTVSYESSDPDIASVDAATGEITAKKPGKVKILIHAAQTDLYKVASAEYELTVDHAAVTAPTAITGLKYNGKAQKLAAPGETLEGKIMYKVNDGEWKEEVPTAVNAGTYTVYYKAVRGEGHGETEEQHFDVNVSQKEIGIEWTNTEVIYDGTEKLPTAAAKGLAEGDTCNITVTGGQTEAGTYTAQAAAIDNANYKLPAETTVTFVIRKADFELTGMPQAKTDLVYDGKEQELITAGSAKSGTLLYKLGDGEWTEKIPSAVHAGTYDVSYKIAGDSNHNDLIGLEVLHIKIAAKSIADADVKLADALKYTGQQQTQEISKVTAGNLEVPKDDYEVTGNQAAEAGVYTMTITAKEGTNFTGSREWTYVVAPVKMSQITKDKDGKVQIGHGTFSVKIEQDKDTAQAALVTSEAEFIEKLVDAGDITADELTRTANGASMELLLHIQNESSLGEESRTQIQKKAAEKGYTPGTCFKLSLKKYMTENGTTDQGTVISQNGKIKLTLQIPESLQNQNSKKDRTYFILCSKNGNVEALNGTYDAKAKTITFEAEDYADYALVYQETDKPDNGGGNDQEPETDDNTKKDNNKQNGNKDNNKNNNNKNNNKNNNNNNQNNPQNNNGNGSQKSGITTTASGTSATTAGSTVKAANTADSANVFGNILAFLEAWMILLAAWIRRKTTK